MGGRFAGYKNGKRYKDCLDKKYLFLKITSIEFYGYFFTNLCTQQLTFLKLLSAREQKLVSKGDHLYLLRIQIVSVSDVVS